MPFVANIDSPPAVIFVSGVFCVVAAGMYIMESFVRSCWLISFCRPMNSVNFRASLFMVTAATLCMPFFQLCAIHNTIIAAIA